MSPLHPLWASGKQAGPGERCAQIIAQSDLDASPFLRAYAAGKLQIVYENEHWFAALDAFPSKPGPTLIIPRRRFTSYFEIKPDEWAALDDMFKRVPPAIGDVDLKGAYETISREPPHEAAVRFLSAALRSKHLNEPTEDYTIAINEGVHAGRTVDHLHIHLVPRRAGDVEDPVGGFRAMFPDDGNYLKTNPTISALEAANRYYNTDTLGLQYFHSIRRVRGVMKELGLMLEGTTPDSLWLDIGFGPGIEFQEIVRLGQHIDGLDISGPMKILLEKILDKEFGIDWRQRAQLYPYSMQEFPLRENHYDRIWAMATFLHLDRHEIAPMINKYGRGLKKGGRMFLNFKVGEQRELVIDSAGRPFNNFTEESFREEILPQIEGLKLRAMWIPDVEDALGRGDVRWLQIIFERE